MSERGKTVFILASNNRKKLKELSELLTGMGICVVPQSEAGCDFEAEETGETFSENAVIKAQAACEATGLPAIADDSGISVFALGGAPGVKSARYGGSDCKTDAERSSLLLSDMEGVKDRGAKFVSSIACLFPDGTLIRAEGECRGEILEAPRGEGGFGYDPIFLPEGETRSMAELSPEEKNAISHRGKALRIFERELRRYYADK